jgi:hypothetical protein
MRYFLTMFFVTFIAFSGCNRDYSRPSDLPKLVPCEITIKQEGVPLSGGNVTIFNIASGVKFRTAGGVTDNSGVAILKTYGFKGVPVGKYKVTASKTILDNKEVEVTVSKSGDKITKGLKTYQLVDSQYVYADNSDFEIEIVSSGKNIFSFDVGKPVRDLFDPLSPPPPKK